MYKPWLFRDFNQSQLKSLVNSNDLLSLSGSQRDEARALLGEYEAKATAEANLQARKDNAIAQSRAKLFSRKAEADASMYKASLEAGQAATNSSRLLAEFEKERSFKRVLSGRAMDKAGGQIRAGFSASEVTSIGAEQESYRASNLERVNLESGLNRQKQEIVNRGSMGISQAFASVVSQASAVTNAAEAVNTAKSIGVKKI